MKPDQRLANRPKHRHRVFPVSRTTPDHPAVGFSLGPGHGLPWHDGRRMNGVVVVDKPAEMTSAQVVAEVKTVLGARKVGHTGTLDPFATGVLVCCLNQATRLAQFLTPGKKCYQAVMRLGIRTDTHDFTGRVLSREASLAVTHSEIHSTFKRFLEVKEQAPPAFSALKHHGMPLYKLARRGTFVQKPLRPISIYKLVVYDIDLPDVHFEVRCSEGTYVRTLCADIGDALGCGAHLVGLRRTESSGFTLGEAVSLNTMKALCVDKETSKFVIPMREAIRGIPEVQAWRALAQKIRHGQPITRMELGPLKDDTAPWIKVTDTERHLIAVLGSREKNGVLPYKCVFLSGNPDPKTRPPWE